jgi:hypothetical protein
MTEQNSVRPFKAHVCVDCGAKLSKFGAVRCKRSPRLNNTASDPALNDFQPKKQRFFIEISLNGEKIVNETDVALRLKHLPIDSSQACFSVRQEDRSVFLILGAFLCDIIPHCSGIWSYACDMISPRYNITWLKRHYRYYNLRYHRYYVYIIYRNLFQFLVPTLEEFSLG